MRTTHTCRHPRPLSAVALLALLAPASARGLGEEIDALFAAYEAPGTPGAAVAVVEDGRVVHSAGYGLAQLEYEVEITPETIFHAASVSKQFTAMAVVLLALDGKLSLDDDVREHLPWVPDFGAEITLRHLLHHTSGLRDQWEGLAIAGWRLDDVITRDHVRSFVERQRELNFLPGERHLYCNTGYTLLAEVAAEASGESFRDFTRERILEPLGMSSTHFHDDHEHIVPNRAYSYQPAPGGGFRNSVLSYANAGATSLFTTAADLARWLENFDHHRVGGEAAFALLAERTVLNDGRTLPYAGGILFGEFRGHETIWHNGGDAGFRSHVVWFPDLRLGVVVLSNHSELPASDLALKIAELRVPVFERETTPAAPAPPASEPEEDAPAIEITAERLERLAGTYATADRCAVEVERRGARLYLRIAGLPRRRLFPESATSLRALSGDVTLRLPAGDGPCTELELALGERRWTLARLPDDDPPALRLAAYVGRYECPELETCYSVALEGEALVVRHFRHGSFPLKATWPDTFTSERWFFRTLEFTRGADGEVDGFRLQGNRVLGLRFVRVG